MNEMCRFCLSVTSEETCIISEESEVLQKIKTCLSIEISLSKLLPSRICSICVNRIEEIYNYHKTVSENQQLLLKLIKESYSRAINLTESSDAESKSYDFEIFHNDLSFSDKVSIKDQCCISSDDELLSKVKQDKENKYNKILTQNVLIKDSTKTKRNVKNSENIQHKCLFCFKHSKSQNDLIKHYYKHKEEIINDRLKSERDGRYIKKILDGDNLVFECSTCCKRYDKYSIILKHLDHHLRPFTCKLCGRTYKTVHEIIRHSRAHNGFTYHCSQRCGFSTVYKGALKEHEKRHGTPEFKYTCAKCGKGFQVKTWHDQHQNVHSGQKPYVCDICGAAFHMDRYLTAHRSKKHPQTAAMKRHVCVECSLPCDSRNSLNKHNIEVHGVRSSLLCDQCGKEFTNSELLKYHKNRHLGVKPYACSVCNKKFAKKFNLKIHEQTHTGARAHVCPQCGKTFTQNSALRRHKRRYHPEMQLKEKINSADILKE